MSVTQSIILAGGLGTRLRSVVSDLPKCMAPVNGRPFLAYVVDYLKKEGISKFIFSLGYKHEAIVEFVTKEYGKSGIDFSVEEEPLGTGGAIKLACKESSGKDALIVNGDTLFKVKLNHLNSFHDTNNADCTLSLKPMQNFDRYGVVELNKDNSIKDFKEKRYYGNGFINGGIYALNVANFLKEELPDKFSFEKDYLEKFVNQRRFFAVIQNEYFIDIGIPEDYERAKRELTNVRM